jgi:hypothetical protein
VQSFFVSLLSLFNKALQAEADRETTLVCFVIKGEGAACTTELGKLLDSNKPEERQIANIVIHKIFFKASLLMLKG